MVVLNCSSPLPPPLCFSSLTPPPDPRASQCFPQDLQDSAQGPSGACSHHVNILVWEVTFSVWP